MLVTVHGSGSNNALLMEEGSALIEVRPYDFGTRAHGWANFFMPKARRRTLFSWLQAPHCHQGSYHPVPTSPAAFGAVPRLGGRMRCLWRCPHYPQH